MYQRLIIFTYNLERNKILQSIKKGFLMLMPVLMVGALALVIRSFPVLMVQQWLTNTWDGAIYDILNSIYNVTYGMLSLYLAISISYNFFLELDDKNSYLRVLNMILSVSAVAACLGYGEPGFQWSSFGPTGVFTAMLISLLSTWIFYYVYRGVSWLVFHRGDKTEEVDYRHLSTLLIPFAVCLIFFFLMNRLLYWQGHFRNLNEVFAYAFGSLFASKGNSIGAGLLLVLTESILWFFGIHGGNALEQVQQNLFVTANLSPSSIVSKTFIDTFGFIGGCGNALCLFLAIMIVAREKKNRSIARTSAFPILFNVNEPLIFGLPIVFNPVLLLPFIIVPVLSVYIAYAATVVGIIPVTTQTVAWTTPVFLSGYVATGSIGGSLIQLLIIILGTLVYVPFVKLMEHANVHGESMMATQLEKTYKAIADEQPDYVFINQHNSMARLANTMVERLQDDIENKNIKLYYQPQMTPEGRLYGAEALLRWSFGGKLIYPPLVVHLAEEVHIVDQLSMAVIRQGARDTKIIKEEMGTNLKISVNITAVQLNNSQFIEEAIQIIENNGVASQMSIEVTEEISMDHMENIAENIALLHTHGIGVSMDDFSMGHTSLKFLQESEFSHVKIDGQMVKNMMDNVRSCDIIASIIQLGKTLDFKVVAEFVDTEEKREKLVELGCDYLQGYLFSPAIPRDEFIEMFGFV